MKVIDASNLTKKAAEAVLKEVRILSDLNNQNIVKYIESFPCDDKYYIIMENCAGGDLARRIEIASNLNSLFKEEVFCNCCLEFSLGCSKLVFSVSLCVTILSQNEDTSSRPKTGKCVAN